MERADLHTHTWLSGHGSGTVDEVVRAARAQGLSTVALTEHLPLPSEVDDGTFAMPASMMGAYFESLSEARLKYPDIEILFGTEIDWRWGAEAYILEWLNAWPFELRLGSVHMLTDEGGNPWEFDHPDFADGWNVRGEEKVWEDYLVLWKQMLASSVPIDIVAHPDLPKKLDHKPCFDTSDYYAEMVAAAVAADVMIEVNTAGLHKPVHELYPAPTLLKLFCEAGVGCIVSSDAHNPAHVGRDLDLGYAAMRTAGYTHITVPTPSGDRREIALD